MSGRTHRGDASRRERWREGQVCSYSSAGCPLLWIDRKLGRSDRLIIRTKCIDRKAKEKCERSPVLTIDRRRSFDRGFDDRGHAPHTCERSEGAVRRPKHMQKTGRKHNRTTATHNYLEFPIFTRLQLYPIRLTTQTERADNAKAHCGLRLLRASCRQTPCCVSCGPHKGHN